jgi:hypothetical protein
VVTIDDARAVGSTLARSYEAVVRNQLRFRVGQIVYVAFSRDETLMGFAFPKEERDALVASEPNKFLLPRQSELRFNWVCVRLDAIDHDELHELIPLCQDHVRRLPQRLFPLEGVIGDPGVCVNRGAAWTRRRAGRVAAAVGSAG